MIDNYVTRPLQAGDTVRISCGLTDDYCNLESVSDGAIAELINCIEEPEWVQSLECDLCPHMDNSEHPKCYVDFDFAGVNAWNVRVKKSGDLWWVGEGNLTNIDDLI